MPINNWLKGQLPNFIWILWWAIFIYIWGFWTWRDNPIFSLGWWLDETGHAVYGFAAGLNAIYLFKRRKIIGAARISGRRRFWLTLLIVSIAWLLGFAWEIIEMIWDLGLQPHFFQWLAKAVKGDVDTLIDLAINPLFAFLAVQLYCLYEKKFYSDEDLQDEIEEIMAENIVLLKRIKENLTQVSGMKREFAKRKILEHWKHLRTEFKDILLAKKKD